MEEKRIVLKFKQIDSLRSFHEILEKTGQFELKEDRDLLGVQNLSLIYHHVHFLGLRTHS